MDLKIVIGQRLKIVREKSKLSQYDIAKELNIAQATIAQYERGRTCAPAEILDWYHKRFNVSFDYLFGYVDDIKEILTSEDKTEEMRKLIRQEMDQYFKDKK
ncbi:MAG: helix-turn-helix domain-containing protein [Bacilli bacterium]|nr:helix-turn-helix domain-containing protein [Bacilli bacterium]